jgi:hypothetical protein
MLGETSKMITHSGQEAALLVLSWALFAAAPATAARLPSDLSGVRGFNYTPSSIGDSERDNNSFRGFWSVKPEIVERELGYAKRLNLNNVRVFVPYSAWASDKSNFPMKLRNFIRQCHALNIEVMVVLFPDPQIFNSLPDTESRPILAVWVQNLVEAVAGEPGMAFWDAANEPDNLGYPVHNLTKEQIHHAMEDAKWMADTVHRFDKNTPVTIGCTYVPCMEELAGYVDVLSYHDYSPTRSEIRLNIEEAMRFAAQVHKPVFNTEMACIGRANPYDVALQEYQQAGIGWYLWELMITRYWGDIHGVFYPDGTVRDPSIPAAVLGFFRSRSSDVVLENPDREGFVTRAVNEGRNWLTEPTPDWKQGLDIAELQANLLESAQLVAMREPPARTVELLRAGQQDIPKLRKVMQEFVVSLEPFQKK